MATALRKFARVFNRRPHRVLYLEQRRTIEGYDKNQGVPRDFLIWLQQDYDFSIAGMKRTYAEVKRLMLLDSQKYIPERHKILGPDLATAHFIVKRGGSVRFVDRDEWFKQDENGKYYVPNRKVDGFSLEAVDASKTKLIYLGLDNFENLPHLRYLNLSDCPYIDDWCLSRLHRFGESLEFLDISGCQLVTDDGLATLHHLRNLKALKVANLPKVKHLQLMVLLLEEANLELQVFGVDFNPTSDDSDDSKTAAEDNHCEIAEKG